MRTIRAIVVIVVLSALCTGLTFLTVGCGEPIPNASTVTLSGSEAVNIYPTTIDSCEYFVTYVRGGKTITHKGNCKNPIHYCDRIVQSEQKIKELEEQKRQAEEQLKLLKK